MPGGRRTGGRLKTPETPRVVELKAERFAVRLAGRLEELIPLELLPLVVLFIAFVLLLICGTVRYNSTAHDTREMPIYNRLETTPRHYRRQPPRAGLLEPLQPVEVMTVSMPGPRER